MSRLAQSSLFVKCEICTFSVIFLRSFSETVLQSENSLQKFLNSFQKSNPFLFIIIRFLKNCLVQLKVVLWNVKSVRFRSTSRNHSVKLSSKWEFHSMCSNIFAVQLPRSSVDYCRRCLKKSKFSSIFIGLNVSYLINIFEPLISYKSKPKVVTLSILFWPLQTGYWFLDSLTRN